MTDIYMRYRQRVDHAVAIRKAWKLVVEGHTRAELLDARKVIGEMYHKKEIKEHEYHQLRAHNTKRLLHLPWDE